MHLFLFPAKIQVAAITNNQMPQTLKKILFSIFGFILTLLLTTIITIYLIKFAFLNVDLNQRMVRLVPLKEPIEQLVIDETGLNFSLNENDEQVLRSHLEKWTVNTTLYLNGKLDELKIDPKGEFEQMQSKIEDPILKEIIGQAAADESLNRITDPNQTEEMQQLLNQADMISLGISKYTIVFSVISILLIFALIAADLKLGLTAVKKSFLHTGIGFVLFGGLMIVLLMQIGAAPINMSLEFNEIIEKFLKRTTYISMTFGLVFVVMGISLRQIIKKLSTPQM